MKLNRLFMMIGAVLVFASTNGFAQGPNNSGTYYKDADGKKGAALKTALCEIIRKNLEQNVVSYTPGLWNAYPTTDAKPDDATKVWDMYSDISDFTFGAPDQDSGSGGSTEGDKYNREHSFPREWFGGAKAPMNTDLFHVYPTDKLVNNRRSSYPFGETTGEGKGSKYFKSHNNFSKLGDNTRSGYTGTVFEPNDIYKGDFARTYFYMVTCYENEIPSWTTAQAHTLDGNKYPGLQEWQLNMLMEWSKNDPVDQPVAKETPRNNAVYGIQKNRNPFIDYPGLEEYIWGDKKNVAFSYDHFGETGIEDLLEDVQNDEPEAIYSPDGRRLEKMQRGLNIVRTKSRRTIKVVIK